MTDASHAKALLDRLRQVPVPTPAKLLAEFKTLLIELGLKGEDEMTTKSAPVDPAALAVPAPFVNRFQVTIVDGTFVRLSFAEALSPDADAYRAAVTMSASNARALALSMLNMLGTTSKAAS